MAGEDRLRAARRVAALAVPALGSLAADPVLSLVDSAFVARLGTVELAALGVDAAVFTFVFALFNFLAYATTPLVSRARAAGDPAAAGRVVERALAVAAAGGAAAAALLLLGAPLVVRVMQAPAEVVDAAVTYMRVRALALPAVLVVTAGHGAFRGIQDTRTPLWISLGIAAVNAVLDPLLMFGLGWGIAGAAAATLAAQWAGAAVFVALLVRGQGVRRLRFEGLRPFLVVGGAIVIRTLLLVGALSGATAVAAGFGAASVGAHQVVSQLWLLAAMTVDALAIAAQTLVAEALGRGEGRRARRLADLLLGMGLVAGLAITALLLAAGPLARTVFALDADVAAALGDALPVAAGMQPVAALVFVADGIYLGALEIRRLVASTAAGLVAMVAGLWVTVETGAGLAGVWWATAAMVAARAAVLAAGYGRVLPLRRLEAT